MSRTELTGRYTVVNRDILEEKAVAADPRQVFYRVMLATKTYEEYLAKVGSLDVEIASYQNGPINGRIEILYARRNGWIDDGTG